VAIAFCGGIQLAFLPYRHSLSFEFEYPLNTEPLRIDAVIIKKRPNLIIDMPLGLIFRQVNILEYKSPGDYFSMRDYLKVGAYVRLYCYLNGIPVGEITISLVGDRFPRKLMKELAKLGYEIREEWPGIYYVSGDMFKVQVIETKKLREGDGGIWLRDLRGGLKGEELGEILRIGKGLGKEAPMGAYLHALIQANMMGFKEMVEMNDAVTIEDVLEEYGFTARWEARGLERGLERDVKKLRKHGMDPAAIAEALELPPATVSRYLDTN
jgi:hypothetical protein